MNGRIKNLDGLRALAAMGVLWIHCWNFHGNPKLHAGRVDLANLLAIGGNGVDLFFVISGFCMYYFYTGKQVFSYATFWEFLKKRWTRLSPAFYTASGVYILFMYSHDHSFPVLLSAGTSLLYLNSVFSQYSAAGLFWTLSVEWQFYLVIPFILIYQQAVGFRKIFTIVLLAFLAAALLSVLVLKKQSDPLSYQLMFRYTEFAWGILVARLVVSGRNYFSAALPWMLLFIIITYAGRVLISNPILSLSPQYHNLFKIAGFSIMSLGFSGILYLALTCAGWVDHLLGNRFMVFVGRISYSFYLWHGIIHYFIGNWIIVQEKFTGGYAPVITFTITMILLLPLAAVSYHFLERPFMKKNIKGI